MEVCGGLWIPPGVVQCIQDKDPSLHLCHVCKDIKINQVQWGIQRLGERALKGKLGGVASVMFAYSSGEMQHLLAIVPSKFKNKRHVRSTRLYFCRTYAERMSVFRCIMWIPMLRHIRLLKT